MMIVMKLLCMLALLAASAPAVTIHDVRTVYLFPMRNALDQYLASRLAEEHVFQVVADPKAADAVFTDRVGPAFEQMFSDRVLDAKDKAANEPRTSFSTGRGTLFLVGKSKQVIWSRMDVPKDSSPKQMARAARRFVDDLKKELSPKVALSSPVQ